MRLDLYLVEKGFVKSRAQAQTLIKEGSVLVNEALSIKPNKNIEESDSVQLTKKIEYVSRGAYKLKAAVEHFEVDVRGVRALDIGSSTGGFTDYLLQNGVAHVTAVDVGTDQFDSDLRMDARVTLLEKTDIRSLETLPEKVSLIVIDVSFISLSHIIPTLPRFIERGATVLALVKPQFEVGKGNLNRQGIVTDTALYAKVLENTQRLFEAEAFTVLGYLDSPIQGGDGNREFLMGAVYR